MEKMKKEAGPAYATSAVGALVVAWVLAYFFSANDIYESSRAFRLALTLWIAFVATTSLTDYMYANRPRKLWAINYGYHLVGMIVVAFILAAWR